MKSINDWDEEELGRLDHWIWLFSDILQLLLVVFGVVLLAASIAGLELTTLVAEFYIAGFMLFIYIFLRIGYRYAIIRQSKKERVYWVGVSVSSLSTFALLLIGDFVLRLLTPSGELGILLAWLILAPCGLLMIYLYYAKGPNFIVDQLRQAFRGYEVLRKKTLQRLTSVARGSFFVGMAAAIELWFLYPLSAELMTEGEWHILAVCLALMSVTLL